MSPSFFPFLFVFLRPEGRLFIYYQTSKLFVCQHQANHLAFNYCQQNNKQFLGGVSNSMARPLKNWVKHDFIVSEQ